MRTEHQGKITYNVSLVIPENAPGIQEYSKEHWLKVLRHNIPEKREVYFNGTSSRTEEMTVDYGVKSKTTIIREANSPNYMYCKEFPYFNFCLDIEDQAQAGSQEYFPPQVELLEEYEDINGHHCRKARIEQTSGIYEICFDPGILVTDPTRAVIQQEGVEGFIIRQDEMPHSSPVYYYRRYTVADTDFSTLAPDLFTIPRGYIKFTDIDAVRKENRRIMNEKAENEWKQKPLNDAEKNMFTGYWLMKSEEDLFVIHIQYKGSAERWENNYAFHSKTLTAVNKSQQEWLTEQAHLSGRQLLVDEPPNYRLYFFNSSTGGIELAGNDLLTFKRSNQEEIQSLSDKYAT